MLIFYGSKNKKSLFAAAKIVVIQTFSKFKSNLQFFKTTLQIMNLKSFSKQENVIMKYIFDFLFTLLNNSANILLENRFI